MKNKKIITLLSLVIAIGVLLCAYAVLKSKGTQSEPSSADTDTNVYVNSYSADNMTEISYTNEKGSFSFIKGASGIWSLSDDSGYPINNSMINNMAGAVSNLSAVRTVENGDEGAFGFDSPTLTVNGKYSDGAELSLTVGITNSFNGNNYLKDNTTGKIYLVQSTLNSSFDYSLSSLTQTDSLPSDIEEDFITSVTVRDENRQSNIITDDEGVKKAYSAADNIDFSANTCYYIKNGDFSEYGISEDSPYIEIAYKAASYSSDESEEEMPRMDASFKIVFGSNHNTVQTKTDSDGESYEENAVEYYYTIPGSKLVYSLSEADYEDIMNLVTYTAETEVPAE